MEKIEKEAKENRDTDEEKALTKTHGKKAVRASFTGCLVAQAMEKLCKALKDAKFPDEATK